MDDTHFGEIGQNFTTYYIDTEHKTATGNGALQILAVAISGQSLIIPTCTLIQLGELQWLTIPQTGIGQEGEHIPLRYSSENHLGEKTEVNRAHYLFFGSP